MAGKTNYVCTVTPEQADQLRGLLEEQGWEFGEVPYSRWQAQRNKTTVTAFLSGKVTVQGRGTADLVQFTIEPQVLHEARFGYETVLAQDEKPEMFTPHAGIDESGKGDYFGPLVVAAAYVDQESAAKLLDLGVQDSKNIKSDRRIAILAGQIRAFGSDRYAIVAIGPEAYNRLYDKIGNVNRLLAWGHAKALEGLLEKMPSCPRAISDQFGRKETVLRALQERGRRIKLEQHPKAEADIAVAAASILARDEFVRRLEKLGEPLGVQFPKGASPQVLALAKELAAKGGRPALARIAKLHFRTTWLALGLTPPEKADYHASGAQPPDAAE